MYIVYRDKLLEFDVVIVAGVSWGIYSGGGGDVSVGGGGGGGGGSSRESYHGDTRQRHSLVLIKAVMATEIPPLDNSFCNYVDDTLGGHFEMNTTVQCKRCALFHLIYLSIILDGWIYGVLQEAGN